MECNKAVELILEFRTATFKKDKEQPPVDNRWLVYILLTVIFFLLTYLLYEFGITGWPIGVLFFAGLISMYLIRYHSWGEKEIVPGHLDKELIITTERIQINELTIEISGVEKLTFELDKYDNQNIYNYDVINKSDGTSSSLTITANGRTFTEYFRIGTETHLTELNRIIKNIVQQGANVEVIKKS